MKAKVKYIPCDIYKRGIYILIGNGDELLEWAKYVFQGEKYEGLIEAIEKAKDDGYASTFYGHGEAIIRLPEFPNNPKDIAVAVHEIYHTANYILWYCNVEYNEDNGSNEAWAYLIEHLTRNILEKEGYEKIKYKEG